MDRCATRRRGCISASGQAKFIGRLAVCAGTTGPGSNHLVAGLYEASRDHAPVLALSGEMPRKMKGTEFFQATEPDLLFRDVSLYTQTITSAEQAPLVFAKRLLRPMPDPASLISRCPRTSFRRKLPARRRASPHCSRVPRSHRMNPVSQRLLNGSMPPRASSSRAEPAAAERQNFCGRYRTG